MSFPTLAVGSRFCVRTVRASRPAKGSARLALAWPRRRTAACSWSIMAEQRCGKSCRTASPRSLRMGCVARSAWWSPPTKHPCSPPPGAMERSIGFHCQSRSDDPLCRVMECGNRRAISRPRGNRGREKWRTGRDCLRPAIKRRKIRNSARCAYTSLYQIAVPLKAAGQDAIGSDCSAAGHGGKMRVACN